MPCGRPASPSQANTGRSEKRLARVTGLEPATSGVTGRHSNQLSYTRASLVKERKPLSRGGLDRFGERLTRRFGTGCQARSGTKGWRPTCLCHATPAAPANGQNNQILSECLLDRKSTRLNSSH